MDSTGFVDDASTREKWFWASYSHSGGFVLRRATGQCRAARTFHERFVAEKIAMGAGGVPAGKALCDPLACSRSPKSRFPLTEVFLTMRKMGCAQPEPLSAGLFSATASAGAGFSGGRFSASNGRLLHAHIRRDIGDSTAQGFCASSFESAQLHVLRCKHGLRLGLATTGLLLRRSPTDRSQRNTSSYEAICRY